ncbi:phosphoribosylformylglycinamidine synthase subunit PurQ [Bacteroidia bacterium]|nr:phosphoribosylformylglycinamidine synthase subunit PurQ [Bacteroidia bacterium]
MKPVPTQFLLSVYVYLQKNSYICKKKFVMKVGVITFPGSNCDRDVVYVLETLLSQRVIPLWHQDTNLQKCNIIVLPGGFTYGDYLRSGAIANLSPIMKQVVAFANKGGLVVGICNGFQILCESGLLPGALLRNTNQLFTCTNQHIRVETTDSAWTAKCKKHQILSIPIAHAEGRYYADEKTLKELQNKDQIVFRYCDAEGHFTPESNPNGSIYDIAGICNKTRNVFGMMPHPERCADDELRNIDGRLLFESILQHK